MKSHRRIVPRGIPDPLRSGMLIVALVALFASTAMPAAHAEPEAEGDVEADATAIDSVDFVDEFQSQEALESQLDAYWTDERLEQAEPMDMHDTGFDAGQVPEDTAEVIPEDAEGVAETHPEYPEGTDETSAQSTPVPRTVGRLFFTNSNGQDSSCSASATAGAQGNTIITAGHCVHGGDGGSFYGNFVFYPHYHNGPSSQGAWYGAGAATFNGWSQSGNYDYDQAFIQLQPKDGQTIVQAVGGNGLVGGAGRAQSDNRIWGYPAADPYDGSLPYFCDSAASARPNHSTDSQASCGFTGGASGGPWQRDRIDENLGYTWAVTSRCAAESSGNCALTYLYAAPNPSAIFDLRDHASSL